MLQTFFNLDILKAAWPILLAGLGNTVLLSLIVVPLGLIGGLALAMLASARRPWVRFPLMAWVDFFRAFPPLVLLDLPVRRPAVRRAGARRLRLRVHRVLPQHRRLLRRDPAGRHRVGPVGPERGRAQHRARPLPDHAVRGSSAGGAQRAARSAFQHAGGGEAHLARQRGGDARASVPGAAGAEPDLQPDADRARRRSSTSSCCGRWCGS